MNSSAGTLHTFSPGDAPVLPVNKENVWLLPVLFFVFNFIIKSFFISKASFDLDEAWHTYFSQKSIGEILKIAGTDPNGPLFNLLFHYWIKIFGVSELATRSMSVILSSATAPLLFILGKKYFNFLTGIFAVLIFSFSDLHFFFSHNARVYALICFLAVLSFLLVFNLLTKQRYPTFILLVVVNTLLLYTHLTTSFFIAAEGIATLLFVKEFKKGARLAITAQIISVALFVPWLLLTPYYHESVHGIWLEPPGWNEVKLALYDLSGTEYILYVFIVLFALSVIIRQKNSWPGTWKLQLAALIWFCIPMLCSIITSHLFVPVFQTKYIMTSSLGLFMLVAYSVSLLRVGAVIKYSVVGYLIFLFFPLGKHQFISEDWRSAVNEVLKRKTDRTMVIVSPWYMHYPFSYYYNREYYKDTKETLELLEKEKIFFGEKSKIILENPTDYDQVILLTAHEKMISPESILKHLRNNFLPECDTAFPTIKMYCFKKPATERFANDMEKPAQSFKANKIVESNFAHSGARVSLMDKANPYSATFEDRAGAFSPQSTSVMACAWAMYQDKNTDCVFVVSFENKNGTFLYEKMEIAESGTKDKWFRICQEVKIPEQAKPDDIVKVYFWNKGSTPVYVDDMEVTEIK